MLVHCCCFVVNLVRARGDTAGRAARRTEPNRVRVPASPPNTRTFTPRHCFPFFFTHSTVHGANPQSVFCEVPARCLHAGNDDSFQDEQSFKGQEGGGGKCPGAQRRRAGGHVRARAQPAPAWADQGRRGAAEAEAADSEEPGLRRQLPHQARHPEGGAGEAKDRPAARGGQAGPGERQHEAGAGRAASQVRGPAVFRPDCDPRAPLAGQGGDHQRHHHRQVGQPQQQQLQPNAIFGPVLVSTGLGFSSIRPGPSPPGSDPSPENPLILY